MSRSDILGSDGPVVGVVVDELVSGVSAAECDFNCEVDFIILKPIGTCLFRDLVRRNATQIRGNFDEFVYSSYSSFYVSCKSYC